MERQKKYYRNKRETFLERTRNEYYRLDDKAWECMEKNCTLRRAKLQNGKDGYGQFCERHRRNRQTYQQNYRAKQKQRRRDGLLVGPQPVVSNSDRGSVLAEALRGVLGSSAVEETRANIRMHIPVDRLVVCNGMAVVQVSKTGLQ